MNLIKYLIVCFLFLLVGCGMVKNGGFIKVLEGEILIFNFWKNVMVYFLLVDWFNNGD